MASSSIYRQLVLFDCNDGRLSLFKNHGKYLSRIPSNCECYIFWNDLKLPVYKRLKWILRSYSNIHLRPFYCEQMDDSRSPDLLFYLDELTCKFSSILLVHGDDQSYENVFKRVRKQYGNGKMGLETIDKPFSQHLPRILTRLCTNNLDYSHHVHPEKLSSKDQLKHGRRCFSSNSISNYDNNPIPYTFEEYTNFKHITKRKQKNLNIYFHNTRLYDTTQFSADFDVSDPDEQYHDYLSILYGQAPSSVFETDLQKIQFLWSQCSARFRYTLATTQPTADLSEFLNDEATIMDEQIRSTKLTFNSVEKLLCCPKCTNEFESTTNVIQNFDTKHTDLLLANVSQLVNHLSNRTMWLLEETMGTELITFITSRPVFCSQCSKNFKSVNDCIDHFHDTHAIYNPSAIYDEALNEHHTQATRAQIQLITAKAERHLIARPFFCIKCSKNFTRIKEIKRHLINSHLEPTLSDAVEPQNRFGNKSHTNDSIYLAGAKSVLSAAIKKPLVDELGVMVCPKVYGPTQVFMCWQTMWTPIGITYGKTNRCPHAACRSKAKVYQLEGLDMHMRRTTKHENAYLNLQCCSQTIAYNLKQYRKHIFRLN